MKKSFINIGTLILLVVSVVLFTGCNSATEINSDVVNQTKEWNIQLVVEDTAASLKNSGSYLGQRTSAEDGKDKHDLKALGGSFSGKYLSVIFPIDGSGEGYNTDYHKFSEDRSDSWMFTVKTNDPDSTITVSWRGVYALFPTRDEQNRIVYERELRENDKLLSHMQLVDVETNETVSAFADNKMQSYTFNMDGKTERTFRWELLKDTVIATAQDKSMVASMKANAKLINQSSTWIHEAEPTQPPSI